MRLGALHDGRLGERLLHRAAPRRSQPHVGQEGEAPYHPAVDGPEGSRVPVVFGRVARGPVHAAEEQAPIVQTAVHKRKRGVAEGRSGRADLMELFVGQWFGREEVGVHQARLGHGDVERELGAAQVGVRRHDDLGRADDALGRLHDDALFADVEVPGRGTLEDLHPSAHQQGAQASRELVGLDRRYGERQRRLGRVPDLVSHVRTFVVLRGHPRGLEQCLRPADARDLEEVARHRPQVGRRPLDVDAFARQQRPHVADAVGRHLGGEPQVGQALLVGQVAQHPGERGCAHQHPAVASTGAKADVLGFDEGHAQVRLLFHEAQRGGHACEAPTDHDHVCFVVARQWRGRRIVLVHHPIGLHVGKAVGHGSPPSIRCA